MAAFTVTPGTIAKDVATTITFASATSIITSGTSKIKIVASGVACTDAGIGGGTEQVITGDGSAATADFTLDVDSTAAKVCYAQDGTTFADSGKTINSASKAEAHMSCRSAEV